MRILKHRKTDRPRAVKRISRPDSPRGLTSTRDSAFGGTVPILSEKPAPDSTTFSRGTSDWLSTVTGVPREQAATADATATPTRIRLILAKVTTVRHYNGSFDLTEKIDAPTSSNRPHPTNARARCPLAGVALSRPSV